MGNDGDYFFNTYDIEEIEEITSIQAFVDKKGYEYINEKISENLNLIINY